MRNGRTYLVSAFLVLVFASLVVFGSRPDRGVNRWTAGSMMLSPRSGACLALLEDGGVLVSGGVNEMGVLARAEIYTESGRFIPAAPMQMPRSNHSCAVLDDGRVLVLGGRSTGGALTNTAELYHPGLDVWLPAGPLSVARDRATVTLLRDGHVLVAGGEVEGQPLASLEVYEPIANAFVTVEEPMSSPRSGHAAAVLEDGRVLIAGGWDGSSVLASIELFDPVTRSLMPAGTLSIPRRDFTATRLADGSILFAGGANSSGELSSTEIYNPSTGQSRLSANLLTLRRGHQAHLLPENNTVLIFGGTSHATHADVEQFVPWLHESRRIAELSQARSAAGSHALSEVGRFIVAGGSTQSGTLASTEVLSFPTITTDRPAYLAGQTMTITGAGWEPGERVRIVVHEDPTIHGDREVTLEADSSGSFSWEQEVEFHDRLFTYYITVSGTASGGQAQVPVRAGGNLDQCANGAVGTPVTPCTWVNGNLNASKAQFVEGDSVPYRLVMTGLSPGANTLILEWDTTESGKHAFDYLTTWNRSYTGNPCQGVSGCSLASPTTLAIPLDPNIPGGIQLSGQFFTLFGGALTGAGSYTLSGTFSGHSSTRITVTFNATSGIAVLAWGGHIARRADWGQGNAAVNISGSPYHMRLIDLNGGGGNQDRSISADAVLFPATITIVKEASPEGATGFSFTASPSPLSNFTLIDNGTSANTRTFSNILSFGDYTVSELVPAGWKLDSISCSEDTLQNSTTNTATATASLKLEEGESITCTFRDSVKASTLRVIKNVVNDDGGALAASAFTVHVKKDGVDVSGSPAAGSATGTVYTLSPGVYVVSEDAPPFGYTQTGFSGACNSTGTVTVPADGEVTCTITNNDVAPKLTVVKTVINNSGGTANSSNFNITVSGSNFSPVSFPGAGEPGTDVTVKAGSYNVTEIGPSGYTGSFSAECSGTIQVGQTKKCTITNDDNAAQLVVIKHVINDNGGTAVASNFTMSLTGNSASPALFAGAESPGTPVTLNPGSYSVTETGPSGYAASFSTDCSGSIALGQTKTCTVTNDDIAPRLIVIKHVVNDNGGTAVASNFTMSVTGNPASPTPFAGSESPGIPLTLKVGSYSVGETGPSGYAASFSTDCGGSIALGDTKTCTVTNDDIAPRLIVIKHVVNDNGGTAVASNFTMSVTGNPASPAPFAGAESPGTSLTLKVGSYSVGETGPSGYSATFSADCTGALVLADTKTCTVTNDDVQPTLIVIKHVVNNNGGTATAANFTMQVTATNPSQASFSGAESPGTTITLSAGSYSVTETGLPGYAATFSNCSGIIGVGEIRTCTVTNDDIPPQLTVFKQVINDDGGLALPGSFTMRITNNSVETHQFPGSSSGTTRTLVLGSYSVSETGPGGYVASTSGACSGTIAIGESKICTITNDDIAPQLEVVKLLVPNNDSGRFDLRIDGVVFKASAGHQDSTGPRRVRAGMKHKVDETGTSLSTMDDYVAIIGGDCDSDGGITLGLNQSATCTITNMHAGRARVVKTLLGQPPVLNQSFEFQLRQGASHTSAGTILESQTAHAGNNGTINFTTKLVPSTTYQICETVLPGWLTSLPQLFQVFHPDGDNSVVCSDFTAQAGETLTFTVNNSSGNGLARTIGFWKNWASCSNSGGKQAPVLDQTLAAFPIAVNQTTSGVYLGDLYVDTCAEAVSLLNKSDVITGQKMASDPAYNLAAQLLAAQLNAQAGAATCPAAVTAILDAQALLDLYNFTGTGSYREVISDADAATMNSLAATIDSYNNNNLCIVIP